MKIYNIQTNLNSPTEKEDTRYSGNFDGDIHMTMGPISLYQFNEFASHGLMALRLFQYIKTKQGLVYGSKPQYKGKDTSHLWVYVDNKNLYDWVGLSQPSKWSLLKKLQEADLIEYETRGPGKMPLVKIKSPKKKLN